MNLPLNPTQLDIQAVLRWLLTQPGQTGDAVSQQEYQDLKDNLIAHLENPYPHRTTGGIYPYGLKVADGEASIIYGENLGTDGDESLLPNRAGGLFVLYVEDGILYAEMSVGIDCPLELDTETGILYQVIV